ncbi:MAG: hypothetical protein WKF59_20090 [Chitinophagaceae bacterium]
MDIKEQIIQEYLTKGCGYRKLADKVWCKPHHHLQMGAWFTRVFIT